ncbi:MAG: DUF4340 domain-containing protein [Myxococcota bacterium]
MSHLLKKTFLPLTIIIVLTGGIYFLWPSQIEPPRLDSEKIESDKELPVKVEDLKAMDTLIVKNIHGRFIIKKSEDENGWKLEHPQTAPVDEKIMQSLLAKLGGRKFTEIIASDPDLFKKYKLTPRDAVRVTLKQENKILADFYLGKSRKYTLVRKVDSNNIWNYRGHLRQFFVKDVIGWLDNHLVPHKSKEIKQITWFNRRGEKLFSFKREKKTGKITPVFGEIPEDFYPAAVTRKLIRLLRLRIARINNNKGMETKYFSKPRGSITLLLHNNKKLKLTFGKKEGKYVSVKTSYFDWFPMIIAHHASKVLVKNKAQITNPRVFVIDKENVKEVEAKCNGLLVKFAATGEGEFKITEKNMNLVVAHSSILELLSKLEKGRFLSSRVMLKDSFSKKTGLSKSNDYLKIVDKKGESTTIRFGKVVKSEIGQIKWRYIDVSKRPNRVFVVDNRRARWFCRSQKRWKLESDDMEHADLAKIKTKGTKKNVSK